MALIPGVDKGYFWRLTAFAVKKICSISEKQAQTEASSTDLSLNNAKTVWSAAVSQPTVQFDLIATCGFLVLPLTSEAKLQAHAAHSSKRSGQAGGRLYVLTGGKIWCIIAYNK